MPDVVQTASTQVAGIVKPISREQVVGSHGVGFSRKAAGEKTCILRICPRNPSPNRTLSEVEKTEDPYPAVVIAEGPLIPLR